MGQSPLVIGGDMFGLIIAVLAHCLSYLLWLALHNLEPTFFLCFPPRKPGDDLDTWWEGTLEDLSTCFCWLAEAGSWWITSTTSTSIERVCCGPRQNRIMLIIFRTKPATWPITAFKRNIQKTMGSMKKGMKCSLKSSISTWPVLWTLPWRMLS